MLSALCTVSLLGRSTQAPPALNLPKSIVLTDAGDETFGYSHGLQLKAGYHGRVASRGGCAVLLGNLIQRSLDVGQFFDRPFLVAYQTPHEPASFETRWMRPRVRLGVKDGE